MLRVLGSTRCTNKKVPLSDAANFIIMVRVKSALLTNSSYKDVSKLGFTTY